MYFMPLNCARLLSSSSSSSYIMQCIRYVYSFCYWSTFLSLCFYLTFLSVSFFFLALLSCCFLFMSSLLFSQCACCVLSTQITDISISCESTEHNWMVSAMHIYGMNYNLPVYLLFAAYGARCIRIYVHYCRYKIALTRHEQQLRLDIYIYIYSLGFLSMLSSIYFAYSSDVRQQTLKMRKRKN